MRKLRRPGILALAILLALPLGGCGFGGPSASSSTAQATVKGKLTRLGKPMAKVEVRFNPTNSNRRTAPIVSTMTGPDGSYEITTLAGDNSISLNGKALLKASKKLAYFNKAVDLQAGENTIDLPLP